MANVPNILLQEAWDIRVYGYCADYTKVEKRFKVVARTKPSNYVYEETDIKNYNDLEERINELNSNMAGLSNGVGIANSLARTASDKADNAITIANSAGSRAYSVSQTLDYVIEPNLANHEERITDLENNSGKETLVVTIQGGIPSCDTGFIYNYVSNGGNVLLFVDGMYLALTTTAEDMATFNFIGDDCTGFQYTVINGECYITDLEYATSENFNNLDARVGDIENALNEITALQATYIGGAE